MSYLVIREHHRGWGVINPLKALMTLGLFKSMPRINGKTSSTLLYVRALEISTPDSGPSNNTL